MNKLAFKVKKAAEKSILQGHPWVYESSITKQSKAGQAGDIAIVFDQRNNKFLALGLYDPDSIIRIKILHQGSPLTLNKSFFFNKISTALAVRSQLLETETTAYRLVYGENDGLPNLIIDIYNDSAVIKLYSGIWFPYLESILEILKELIGLKLAVVRLNRILQQQKTPIKDGTIVLGKMEKEEVIFLEHGLKFQANLIKGHKTGYFLDHRNNRLKVRSLSKEKKVLDIFSYAGGFSINALEGGAREVTSIDISEQALKMAKANALLNFDKPPHKTMAIDAFQGLKQLADSDHVFDLIICDPPSFAKSQDQIQKALYSYRKLLKAILPLIAKKGILLMASCSSRIDKKSFYELVEEELRTSNRHFKVLERTAHDIDHPEGIKELSYLKAIYIQFEKVQ